MTVAELIAKLQEIAEQDAQVFLPPRDWSREVEDVEVTRFLNTPEVHLS